MTDKTFTPPRETHPRLRKRDDARQRGDDPDGVVGKERTLPAGPDPDPEWQPVDGRIGRLRDVLGSIGKEHRPHREDVYPYLLIRAMVGDRGKRPTWPPIPCWESPDILLIDAAYKGPFDPARLVASPTAGRTYRVFVRVWNLGLVPAVGTMVRVWVIQPGFFGAGNQNDPYYQQHLIGGRWLELADRTRPGCVAVAELDQRWTIDVNDVGHHCMIAEVSCPLDNAPQLLLANSDRHVGQRNLEILLSSASLAPLLATLGGLVPDGFTLEMIHGGHAVQPVMQAITGGALRGADGRRRKLLVAGGEQVRGGVQIGHGGVHLLTAMRFGGRTILAESARVAKRYPEAAREGAVFERPGGMRRLLDQIGPERWNELGAVGDRPLSAALADGLANICEVSRDELTASNIARALAGKQRAGTVHPLRFVLTDPEGQLVGGYTIVVG